MIVRALHVLDTMTDKIQLGNDVNRHDIAALLMFLREFAGGSHHVKEDAILVPALMQAGMSARNGPLADMLQEHVRIRTLTVAMSDAIARKNKDEFVLYASRYVKLLLEHMAKENDVLFEQAEQILSDEEDEKIVDAFEHFERVIMGAQAHAALLQTLETSASKYLDAPRAA
jgi:hemerythrin-like domain-containing protein